MSETTSPETSDKWSPSISLVVPARNECESIRAMLDELPADDLLEIIVVDGHSHDGTPDIVRSGGYEVVTQEGRGYGMGVRTGMKIAQGDLVTFVDADGSYDPEAISRMRDLIVNEGYDIVFCSRYMKESGSDDDTFIRWLGNKIFSWALRAMFGVKISDALFFYALAKTEIYRDLEWKTEDFSLCIEVPINIHQNGYKYTEIPSRERPRIAGVSKVNAATDGVKILLSMIKFRLGLY